MKVNVTDISEFNKHGNVEAACQLDRVKLDSRHETYYETKLPPNYGTGIIRIPSSGYIHSDFAADLLGVNHGYFNKLLNEGT